MCIYISYSSFTSYKMFYIIFLCFSYSIILNEIWDQHKLSKKNKRLCNLLLPNLILREKYPRRNTFRLQIKRKQNSNFSNCSSSHHSSTFFVSSTAAPLLRSFGVRKDGLLATAFILKSLYSTVIFPKNFP